MKNDSNNDIKMVYIGYRSKITEELKRLLMRCNAPCKINMALRKLKTFLASLKPSLDKSLKSRVVNKIECTSCISCYVGQPSRHLHNRIKEH